MRLFRKHNWEETDRTSLWVTVGPNVQIGITLVTFSCFRCGIVHTKHEAD